MPLLVLLTLQALGQKPLADLPFERVGNRVYLKGSLNGRAVNVVLDTGAGTTVADDVLAFKAGAKERQRIGAGGAGEKTVSAFVVSDLILTLAGTEVRQNVQVALPLAPMTPMEGRPLETILGYDFLKRYRVEIDYAAHRLRLYDHSDAVPAGATVLPVEFVNNLPQIKGRVEVPGLGPQDVTMMLDTGASTAMTLTHRVVGRLNLGERFKDAPEIVTGGGVGGATKGRRIRLPWGAIGDARLERPVAILESTAGGATGSGATYDVLVGGEALRRFTVTLDYPHYRVFLQPNADWAEPFVGDRTGLGLYALSAGLTVRLLVPGSPATDAGLSLGDVVTKIDGKVPASLEEARRALRAATGDLRLKIRREGKEREVVLKTRETVP